MKKKTIVLLALAFAFVTVSLIVLSWFHHCDECHVKECTVCHFMLDGGLVQKMYPPAAVQGLTGVLFLLFLCMVAKDVGISIKSTPVSLKVKITD